MARRSRMSVLKRQREPEGEEEPDDTPDDDAQPEEDESS